MTVHQLTDLAASSTFPSRWRVDFASGTGLEATINDMAAGLVHMIHLFRQAVGGVGRRQVSVHRGPWELNTDDQILAWTQTLPDIVVETESLEGVGISGGDGGVICRCQTDR